MSQTAAETTELKRACAPTAEHVPGSAFFALMAGLWGSFVTLLAVSAGTLDDAYEWLTGLPIVWEIVMWVLTLPWTVAYLAYDASWAHWVRVTVVALIVLVHLSVAAPRAPR